MRYAYHSHKEAQKAQKEFLLILSFLCFFVAKNSAKERRGWS